MFKAKIIADYSQLYKYKIAFWICPLIVLFLTIGRELIPIWLYLTIVMLVPIALILMIWKTKNPSPRPPKFSNTAEVHCDLNSIKVLDSDNQVYREFNIQELKSLTLKEDYGFTLAREIFLPFSKNAREKNKKYFIIHTEDEDLRLDFMTPASDMCEMLKKIRFCWEEKGLTIKYV